MRHLFEELDKLLAQVRQFSQEALWLPAAPLPPVCKVLLQVLPELAKAVERFVFPPRPRLRARWPPIEGVPIETACVALRQDDLLSEA